MPEATATRFVPAEHGTYEHLIGGRVNISPDDKDPLAEEVERLAGIVADLIESAKRQNNLIGILIDATGLHPVTAQASALGKLVPIVSNMAERVSALELRADEAELPEVDYPDAGPGHALRTYFDGFSHAEIVAYAETL